MWQQGLQTRPLTTFECQFAAGVAGICSAFLVLANANPLRPNGRSGLEHYRTREGRLGLRSFNLYATEASVSIAGFVRPIGIFLGFAFAETGMRIVKTPSAKSASIPSMSRLSPRWT